MVVSFRMFVPLFITIFAQNFIIAQLANEKYVFMATNITVFHSTYKAFSKYFFVLIGKQEFLAGKKITFIVTKLRN